MTPDFANVRALPKLLTGSERPSEVLAQLTESELQTIAYAAGAGSKIYETVHNVDETFAAQYGDRVLLELIQNAHDAHRLEERGEIEITLDVHGSDAAELYVANRGRGFAYQDVQSLRNLATSNKKVGEGIGNKGLGFRSVEAVTDDPLIFSQTEAIAAPQFDGYCFRFMSVSEIEYALNRAGCGTDLSSRIAPTIPRYLMVAGIEEQSEKIRGFAAAGFATVIVLPLRSVESIALVRRELHSLMDSDAPLMLFLDRLERVRISIIDGEASRSCNLRRRAKPLRGLSRLEGTSSYHVEASNHGKFLLVRYDVPKEPLFEAIRRSLDRTPQLRRWLDWDGPAIVSVAIPLDRKRSVSRLYNFLPMAQDTKAPLDCFLDAPFFPDIDRRTAKLDLPLNAFLLDCAATLCAAFALTVSEEVFLPTIPDHAVVDVLSWSNQHLSRLESAFKELRAPLQTARVVPVLAPRGEQRWCNLAEVVRWPDVGSRVIIPRKLVSLNEIPILSSDLSASRLATVQRLALRLAYHQTLPSGSQIAAWAELCANDLIGSQNAARSLWSAFYDDLARLFGAIGSDCAPLIGKRVLLERGGALGLGGADEFGRLPFYRERDGQAVQRAPLPPLSISRRMRFLDESVIISPETLLAFVNAKLISKYDAIEALRGIHGALKAKAKPRDHADALAWAFKVWRLTPESAEAVLRTTGLRVPTRGGWLSAHEALFSSSWTQIGKTLEAYLLEAKEISSDCGDAYQSILVDFADWPCEGRDLSKKQWHLFLEALGVTDGLRLIGVTFQSAQGWTWNSLLAGSRPEFGLDANWSLEVGNIRTRNPNTDYQMKGGTWRIPGQLEYDAMPESARARLSDLVLAYLKRKGSQQFQFRIGRYERGAAYHNELTLPTPLVSFLKTAPWLRMQSGADVHLTVPSKGWGSSAKGRTPPRFLPHVEGAVAEDLCDASDFAKVMFGSVIGLRDWTAVDKIASRLEDLARAHSDIQSNDRNRFRTEYRRAWADAAEAKATLPKYLGIVVRRRGVDEIVLADKEPQAIVVTDDERSFRSRALSDAGRAVLAVNEGDSHPVAAILSASGIAAVNASEVEVRLVVDGQPFVATGVESPFVSAQISWLSTVMLLAHNLRAEGFEKAASSLALEERLRAIRVKFCTRWALEVAGQLVQPPDNAKAYAYDDARYPTIVIRGATELNWSALLETISQVSKLIDPRLRSLELCLLRLNRSMRELRMPSDEELADALEVDVALVRDHVTGVLSDAARLRAILAGIIGYFCGIDEANALRQNEDIHNHDELTAWLSRCLPPEAPLADFVLQVATESSGPAEIRERLNLDFSRYNAILLELGDAPLNDEADLRRQFVYYLKELKEPLWTRIRQHHLSDYLGAKSLTTYLERKSLSFVTFDEGWLRTLDSLSLGIVQQRAQRALEMELGFPEGPQENLPALDRLIESNRKIARAAAEALIPVTRAWCATQHVQLPEVWAGGDAGVIARQIANSGLLDFLPIEPNDMPALLHRANMWPNGMPLSIAPAELGLTTEQVQQEENQRKDEIAAAELAKRSINFAGHSLDTTATNFTERLVELALAAQPQAGWFSSIGTVRLRSLIPSEIDRRKPGGRGVPGRSNAQPSEAQKVAMGTASEWLAYQYLKKKHGVVVDDSCWISSNRVGFCSGHEGDDGAGFDFRVNERNAEWLYEVKSSVADSSEFELTANEMAVASACSADRKRHYRILYVPFVFTPERWTVFELPNPMGERTHSGYQLVGRSSVRMRFERT